MHSRLASIQAQTDAQALCHQCMVAWTTHRAEIQLPVEDTLREEQIIVNVTREGPIIQHRYNKIDLSVLCYSAMPLREYLPMLRPSLPRTVKPALFLTPDPNPCSLSTFS